MDGIENHEAFAVTSLETLASIYKKPAEGVLRKVTDYVTETCTVNVCKCVPYTATRCVTKCVPVCEKVMCTRMVCKPVCKTITECAPACCEPCCNPCVNICYRDLTRCSVCCDPCVPDIKTCVTVCDPCTGCAIKVPVCLPGCCKGDPCVSGRCTGSARSSGTGICAS